MTDNDLFDEGFYPVVRAPENYCGLAKELVEAARLLESDAGLILDTKLSTTLADWLMYKAGVLDEHYQIWEFEERRLQNSHISRMGGAKAVAEWQYAHALAVAREVNSRRG